MHFHEYKTKLGRPKKKRRKKNGKLILRAFLWVYIVELLVCISGFPNFITKLVEFAPYCELNYDFEPGEMATTPVRKNNKNLVSDES